MISIQTSKRIVTISTMALLCAAAHAQSTMNSVRSDNPAPGLSSNLSGWTADMTDTQFAAKAMENNLVEVQMGKLAIANGSSDVKQMGQMMVEDHGGLNDQLKPIAEKLNVAVPTKLSTSDQAILASLKTKSGEQFDDAYIQATMNDHRLDITAYSNEARIGKNPALKNVAANGAQLADKHFQMLEKVAKNHQVSVPSSTSTPSGTQP